MLDVYQFGGQLLDADDLDPVYVLLHRAELSRSGLCRWLLAYFCFYHMGTASWVATAGKEHGRRGFWDRMHMAAQSKDYPRCTERRHFRGQNAIKSVEFLRSKGVDQLFGAFEGGHTKQLKDVMKYVQTWVGFGPWIAFKVADMVDALDICQVEFDTAGVLLFDSPQKGAELMWEKANCPTLRLTESSGEWAIASILAHFSGRLAPPKMDRELGPQEAETILCKWSSYTKGHYKIGEDVAACRKGLQWAGKTKLAQRLLKAGKGELW